MPLHVVDTAGLRDTSLAEVDAVEAIGIERAWGEITQADAVLFLHDLTRQSDPAYREADARIAERLAEQLPASVPVLHLANKADTLTDAPPDLSAPVDAHRQEDADAPLLLSARTGAGLETLRQRLLRLVGWQSAPEGVFIARERHLHALEHVAVHVEEARAHLARPAPALDLLAEELRLAQNALNTITGEFTPDDLLGEIFGKFCIGK